MRITSRISRVVAVACLLSAATAVVCQPASRNAAPDASTTESQLASIKGQVLENDEFTSYIQLISMVESSSAEDPSVLVEDYAIQKLLNDVFTTIPATDKAHAALPMKYKEPSQRQYLVNQLRQALQQETKVTEQEMQEWFKQNKEQFISPERIHAYHLFMTTSADNPASAPATVRKKIEEARAQIDADTTFGAVAQKYSEASSAEQGGDIGWLSHRMPIGPENRPMNILLDDALFKLRTGQVSSVLQTSHGLHLMYAGDRQTTHVPTIDDLKTSGILPGQVVNQKMTSGVREMIDAAVAKHQGKILLDPAKTTELTTNTAAFEIDGQKVTVHDLELLHGPRFTSAFQRLQGDTERVAELMKSVMQDEAINRLTIDRKLDQTPEAKKALQLLGERAASQRRLQAIIAQEYPATDEQAKDLYEKNKSMFRRPEVAGTVLAIAVPEAGSPSDRGKAAEKARNTAEQFRARVKTGENFADVAKELAKDDRNISVTVVERHGMGTSTDSNVVLFDQAAGSLEKGDVSEVRTIGSSVVVAKVDEKSEGEPPPYDQFAARMKRQAQHENSMKARQDVLRMFEAKGLLKWLPGAANYGKQPSGQAARPSKDNPAD